MPRSISGPKKKRWDTCWTCSKLRGRRPRTAMFAVSHERIGSEPAARASGGLFTESNPDHDDGAEIGSNAASRIFLVPRGPRRRNASPAKRGPVSTWNSRNPQQRRSNSIHSASSASEMRVSSSRNSYPLRSGRIFRAPARSFATSSWYRGRAADGIACVLQTMGNGSMNTSLVRLASRRKWS